MQTIVPTDRDHWKQLRTKDVTSTEVAALFGLSPYTTPYELWHRKRSGLVVEIDANDRMKWGTRMEPVIAKGVAEDHMLAIRQMSEYVRDEELRLGASFDYRILSIATKQITDELTKNGKLPEGFKINGADSDEDEILEIKNVDSLIHKYKWAKDENGTEAPPHIELQVQAQMAVTGLKRARICAFVGGNAPELITRTRDEKIIASIRAKVKEFWASIEAGAEPAPDFVNDAEFISEMHDFAQPGKVLTTEDPSVLGLAQRYKKFGDEAKAAESLRKAAKAELLLLIGDAEKVIGPGFKISAAMIAGGHVEYDKDPYRDFRISWPKEKVK